MTNTGKDHTTRRFAACLIAAVAMLSWLAAASAADLTNLRCEYRTNPLGIDVEKPRLSWVIESARRGERQTAYQVLLASSETLLKKDKGDLWDSGKVASDQSIQVEYAGKPLASRMPCHWKVRVWDKDGKASDWSQPALWSMGLLKPADWQAKWIQPEIAVPGGMEHSPAPWVRKVFPLTTVSERALAYVNVMGYYELYVNGQKVGDEVLAPAISGLSRRSFYQTHDITRFLRPGRNCVGLWVDSGWRRRAGALARVQIEMAIGGTQQVVATDGTWTCAPSTRSLLGDWNWDHFGGERVDVRGEIAEWNQAECKKGEWIPAKEIPAPAGEVTAQMCPPNRIGKVLPMAACTALGTSSWELDFGTNLTGWLRLRLPQLAPGQKVVMHYADKRFHSPQGDDTPAGKIMPNSQRNFKTPKGDVCYQTFNQRDEFISAGKTGEQFCSQFNYHGFRYVIIEGLPAQPAPGDAEALLIESDLEPAGTFACSNDLFNRIHQTNLWTLRCLDLGGYMVDCPHRERLGYGDGQVGIESLVMSRNAATFYGKWAVDWLDEQGPSGSDFPHTSPTNGDAGGGGPGWGGAGCVLPWKLYLYYGDRRLLERGYEPARRYVESLDRKCVDGVMRSFGGQWDFIGDWVAPGRGLDTDQWPPKPAAELFNNCYLLYLMDQLSRAADVLGRKDEAEAWRTRINKRRPLIHAAFYDANKQIYALDEQAYQLMPLMTGLVPDGLRGTVSQELEDLIRVKNKGHLDTGMLGTYFLFQSLRETGRNDLAFTMANQKTYPSWGYTLSQGATTFGEQWDGYWSQIHACFLNPGGWFYQGLAGILPDESGPGFKKIVIKPAIVGDLTWVKCGYDSVHGKIVSNWKREGSKLTMDVTIPINTTATVYVPAKDEAGVTEGNMPASKANGVKFLCMENGAAVYEVGSGCYQFYSEKGTK